MNDKPKILVVDDEESIRLSTKYMLDAWFDVITAPTTTKALDLIEKEKFDLIFLDIMIRGEPPGSSLEALNFIYKEYPSIPVVILSGTVTWMQKWDELRQHGASAFLGKPFERSKIKEIVERCLKGEKMDSIW